jgi:DNA-directed RNA polymerase specialized sigma24 family protein
MEEEHQISPEQYALLESADWDSLGKNMLARAIWRGSSRYRVTSTTVFARGLSVEDAVSYIIQSVFEGTRKWDPNEIPLEDWLLNQVDSVMDWWLKLRENRDVAFEELENVAQEDVHDPKSIQKIELEAVLKFGPPSPEKILIEETDEQEAKVFFEAVYDDTSDDPELQEMIIAMLDMDDLKPRVVAEALGVPVEDIYNRKKRLQRHLDKLIAIRERAFHEQEK